MKVKVIGRSLDYGQRSYAVDDEVEVSDADAHVLTLIGRVAHTDGTYVPPVDARALMDKAPTDKGKYQRRDMQAKK